MYILIKYKWSKQKEITLYFWIRFIIETSRKRIFFNTPPHHREKKFFLYILIEHIHNQWFVCFKGRNEVKMLKDVFTSVKQFM